MAKRKKANKADELYVAQNMGRESADVSNEIDLEESVVQELMRAVPPKTFADRARVTSNGKKIGATLTQQMAEYVPDQVDKTVAPHIYKKDTGFQINEPGKTS